MAAGDEAPDAPAAQPPRLSTEKPALLGKEDKHDDRGDRQAIDGAGSTNEHKAAPASPTSPASLAAKRSSIAKAPPNTLLPAFERLPDEIIQQILLAADSNAFASLVLLNSKWRAVSQQAHLYAHHLACSPAYVAGNYKPLFNRLKALQQTSQDSPADSDGSPNLHDRLLADLRRAFARQVKRCRFDAYLRPSRTLIRLVSNSISSSSAPGGEGMQFQASPRGHYLLAYNSSRIYILDVRSATAAHGVEVARELKVLRRPAATCIRDDASVLAVLLTEMQVDLYDLKNSPPRRIQSIILDNSPRAIALSPCGSVLAAAYEGGIEVSSLSPDALSTDRRAVKCDHVDVLAFSFDGTQILGTSVHGAQSNTVILTAPYYDPGSQMSSDDLSALWTTSILFPNTSRDCSHAVLLQETSREEAFWTFAYDRSFETFRAVRVDDLRNGTTYFTGPVPTAASSARLLPCTLPSASYHGDLVAAGFLGKDIWLYGVPEDLDAVTASSYNNGNSSSGSMDPGAPGGFEGMSGAVGGNDTSNSGGNGSGSGSVGNNAGSNAGCNGNANNASNVNNANANSSSNINIGNGGTMSRASSGSPSMRAASARLQDSGNDASVRVPQWQLLCDRQENTFIGGARIGELPGASMVNWVEGFGASSLCERLLVGARGVYPPQPISSDEDGIDFIDGGRLLVVDFDYGTNDGKTTEVTIEVGSKEPEVLEEEHRDIDTEVAIVRRRTVAQKRGKPGSSAALLRNATTAGAMGSHSARSSPMTRSAMPAIPSAFSRSQTVRPAQGNLASSSLRNATTTSSNAAPNDDNEDDDPLIPRRMAAPPTARQRGSALGGAAAATTAEAAAAARTPAAVLPLPGSAAAAAAAAAAADTTSTAEDGETTAISPSNDLADAESILGEEEQEALEAAFDAPYSHASPRSGMTLRRAATAAAMNRRLRPPPATTAGGQPIVYRRADGRREHPHESDADNWVPPPPPYQKDVDPQDLPAFLRHNVPPVAAPPAAATAAPTMNAVVPPPPPVPAPPSTTTTTTSIPGVSATLGMVEPALAAHAEAEQHDEEGQAAADAREVDDEQQEEILPNNRPVSRESDVDGILSGDLYEASPQGSPRPAAAVQPAPAALQEQSLQHPTSSTVPPPVLDLQIPPTTADAAGPSSWSTIAPQPPMLPPMLPLQQQYPPQQQDPYNNFVPKPVANVQTWPLQRPSLSNASGVGGVNMNMNLAAGQMMSGASGPSGGYPVNYPVAYPGSYPYSAPAAAPYASAYAAPAPGPGPGPGPVPSTTAAATIAVPDAPTHMREVSQDVSSPGMPAGDQQAVSPLSPKRLFLGSFMVPRVPVGSNRQSRRFSAGRPSTGPQPASAPGPSSGVPAPMAASINKPLPLPLPQPQPQPQPQEVAEFRQYQQPQQPPQLQPQLLQQHQQQPQYYFPPPQFQQPPRAFSNPVVSNSSPAFAPVEDRPLIISTPRGLTGAFDDSPSRSKSGRRRLNDVDDADDGPAPVIFAPVPRHPQAQERSAELRERLETLSGGGTPVAPVQRPLILPYSGQFPGTPAAGTSALAGRQSSLSRRQSRAERSAAKNMLDAKKRGWRRRNSKKKNKGKEAEEPAVPPLPAPPAPPAPASIGSSATAIPKKSKKSKKSYGAPSVAMTEPIIGAASSSSFAASSRRRGKKKERDIDAASSAWTDITMTTTTMPGAYYQQQPSAYGQPQQQQPIQQQQQYYPAMPSIPGGGPGSSSAYAMQQLQLHIQQQQLLQQQQQQQLQEAKAAEKKSGKCVVM
ncbi:hypothetical protein SCUCBS95973_005854 [Sporothrix curviconia]|uniref:F-box domain-containing protein n=1 Tax=Sporothrix curviconia TaxID=1260050 RepID=A0ABP0C187_9PEZI